MDLVGQGGRGRLLLHGGQAEGADQGEGPPGDVLDSLRAAPPLPEVAPAELEDLLRELPGVADCAVLGVHDDRAGQVEPHRLATGMKSADQVPRAVVVRAEVDLTEEEVSHFLIKPWGPVCPQVTRHVEERASRHKHLVGGVVFVDAIPRSAFPRHLTLHSYLYRHITFQYFLPRHPPLFLAISPFTLPYHLPSTLPPRCTFNLFSPSHPPLFLTLSPHHLPHHLTQWAMRGGLGISDIF